MDAYVLLMLCFFPLFTLRGYRDILKDRFKAFCILTGGAAVFLLLVFLYRFFFEGDFLSPPRSEKGSEEGGEKTLSRAARSERKNKRLFPGMQALF